MKVSNLLGHVNQFISIIIIDGDVMVTYKNNMGETETFTCWYLTE